MGFKFDFTDNTDEVDSAIEDAIAAGLEEAASEMESQAKRNSRVRTGDTKRSFSHVVDGRTAYVGSDAENAIWEEYGTGLYAEDGSGRKTPWTYRDPGTGKFYRTSGKRGTHALLKAMQAKAKVAERIVKAKLRGLG